MDRQPRAPSSAAAALPLLVLAVLACCCGGTRALSFPHYMQCDPRWGSDKMGVPGECRASRHAEQQPPLILSSSPSPFPCLSEPLSHQDLASAQQSVARAAP